MHQLPIYRRILLLTEGRLGVFTSKTAACLLRYRPDDVVAIIDSVAAAAGTNLREAIPGSPDRPILARVAQAASLAPDALFVGVAPAGGALAPELRPHVRAALESGIDVVSGLHTRIAADDELRNAAARSGAKIIDLRVPPDELAVGSGRAAKTACRRILTVGTDCNVGKMVTAFELTKAAAGQGLKARFVATGQTGIMVCGCGIVVDAVVADFIAGAAEALVCAQGDCDVCFIEGQGSIAHPGFSGVTLGLLHGTCPEAMVLVHHVGRTTYRAAPYGPLPSPATLREAYERAAAWVYPAPVVAVALNGAGASAQAVAAERRRVERELNLPAVDPIADGCDVLLTALRERLGNLRARE